MQFLEDSLTNAVVFRTQSHLECKFRLLNVLASCGIATRLACRSFRKCQDVRLWPKHCCQLDFSCAGALNSGAVMNRDNRLEK